MASAYMRRLAPAFAWFPEGRTLQWALVAASFWLMAGLHLDGWAHAHRPGLETFFTPWHAALYSGFFALAGLVAVGYAMGRVDKLGFVGVLVFLAGGVGDMLWHELLGIEVALEALVSPTHLMLAAGMALMVSTPLRHARREGRPTWPAIASAGLLLSALTFFTQFIQPGGRPWPIAGNRPASEVFAVESVTPDFAVFPGGVPSTEIAGILGMAGILIATTLMLAILLPLARRWTLPFGAVAVTLTIAGLLLGLMRDGYAWIGVALVGGLAGDLVLRVSPPRLRLPLFAALLPAALWAAFFVALALTGGVWWSVHMWAGAIATASLAGLALSFAFSRPHAET